jgi:hypothetical protein
MDGNRHFPLGYLLLVVAEAGVLWAIASFRVGPNQSDWIIAAFLAYPFFICLCALVGGLFDQMKRGALVGFVLGTIAFVPNLIVAITGGV